MKRCLCRWIAPYYLVLFVPLRAFVFWCSCWRHACVVAQRVIIFRVRGCGGCVHQRRLLRASSACASDALQCACRRRPRGDADDGCRGGMWRRGAAARASMRRRRTTRAAPRRSSARGSRCAATPVERPAGRARACSHGSRCSTRTQVPSAGTSARTPLARKVPSCVARAPRASSTQQLRRSHTALIQSQRTPQSTLQRDIRRTPWLARPPL